MIFLTEYSHQISVGGCVISVLCLLGLVGILVSMVVENREKRRERIVHGYIDYLVEKQQKTYVFERRIDVEDNPKIHSALSEQEQANFKKLGDKLKEDLKPWVPLHKRRKAKS